MVENGKNFNLYLVEVGNGKFCGGAMKLIPGAELYDHLFHVTVIRDASFWDFIKWTPDLYKGTFINCPQVDNVVCSEITIESVPNENGITSVGLIETEGEVIGKLPCTCKIIPAAVNLIVPKNAYPIQ